MRFRTVLCAAAAVATVMTVAPAHAEDSIGYGTALVDKRYNDGDLGFVNLTFAPDIANRSNRTDRPVKSECHFYLTAERPDSTHVTVNVETDVNAYPFIDTNDEKIVVRPVSVGVKCVVTMGGTNGTDTLIGTVESAGESAAHADANQFHDVAIQSPIRVCSYPTVHWSDNKVQVSTTGFCITG